MWNISWLKDSEFGQVAGRAALERRAARGRASRRRLIRFEELEARRVLSASTGNYEAITGSFPNGSDIVGTPTVIPLNLAPNISLPSFGVPGSYQITQQPSLGSISVNAGGQLVYTPTSVGNDTFSFDVNSTQVPTSQNGEQYAGWAFTFTVDNLAAPTSNVTSPYVVDLINPSQGFTSDLQLYSTSYLWADVTNQNPSAAVQAIPGQYLSLVVPPKAGTFDTATGTYTPPANFTGTDSFTLDLHAPTADSTGADPQFFDAQVTFNLTYDPSSPLQIDAQGGTLNAVTTANAGAAAPNANGTLMTVTMNDGTVYVVTQDSSGTINVTKNGQTFESFAQPATPTPTAAQIAAGTQFAQIGAPTLSDYINAEQGQPTPLWLSDLSLPALAAGQYTITSQPSEGTVAVSSTGLITYTATGSNPTDSFSIEATGAAGTAYASDPTTYDVNVTVSPAPTVPPATMTASVSVAAGVSTTFDPYGLVTGVLSNVAPAANTDPPEPQDTSIVAIATPQNGTLSYGTKVTSLGFQGELTPFFAQYDPVYTPDAGYSGSDSMTFEVHGMIEIAGGVEQYFDTLLTVDFTVAPGSGLGAATSQNTPNPFVINGQTLSIQGGNELNLLDVDFTTATSFNINYNGYSGTFSTTGATPITAIDYTGGTVGDIVDVTTVAEGNTAAIGSGMLSLVGPTYTINATGVQGVGLMGNSGDTAMISDTAAQSPENTVNLNATSTATIMDIQNYKVAPPVMQGLSFGSVEGYGTVLASSNGGNATFIGPTSGSNTFYGSKPYSYIAGSGYDAQAVGFQYVIADSNSPGDIASFYSPANDQSTFTATGGQDYSETLTDSNTSYSIGVRNFPAVYATSQGNDSATLSVGGYLETSEFISSDPYTSMASSNYEFLTYGFANVTAKSSAGGDDTAYFYGVSAHNAFTGAQADSQMIGTDASGNQTYDFQALDFLNVLATSLSTGDAANLSGGGTGLQFIAGPIQNYPVSAALIGAAQTFTIQVFAFQQITATSAGEGGDYASLNDPPGTNTFTGQGSSASLVTPLSTYTAVNFANVAATSDDQGTDDENVGAVDYALTMNGNWVNS